MGKKDIYVKVHAKYKKIIPDNTNGEKWSYREQCLQNNKAKLVLIQTRLS